MRKCGSILYFRCQVPPLANPATFQKAHYAQSKIILSSFSFLQTNSAQLLCFKHHPTDKLTKQLFYSDDSFTRKKKEFYLDSLKNK